ncbi:hypothetical protein V499_05832, partial [Pseudogymnoascus sp. VKM F-103]
PAPATEPVVAAASPPSTTDSEPNQQELEQQRQQRRLERRELRRDDRQRQREIRREARREASREARREARQLESDTRQRSRWQRRAAAAHPNSPMRQALIVRSRERIREERRAGGQPERTPEAQGTPPAFDLRFFGGRAPNTGEEERVARERALLDEQQAEAMAQEELERLAAAGDQDAIASVRRRVAPAAPGPPVGFGPGFVEMTFEQVPGAEGIDGEMGGGPEEVQDPEQLRAARLAHLAERNAWIAESARAMGAGSMLERINMERREKMAREKEEAKREMEELLERMAAKKGRQERERWAGRGGGALERLKVRVGESFGVLEGEVVLARHAHVHHTDPPEALLKSTRAAARANARAAHKAANAISTPPITITPAEKEEVQRAARAFALATEEERIMNAIRSGVPVARRGVAGVIRQEVREGQRVFIHETTEVRTVPVGEGVVDAESITEEIERRNLEVERMMVRLESQRAGVRRGVAELTRMREEARAAGVEPERDQAVEEAVAEMERTGVELERRAAEVRMQGVELQRRRAEVDGRRMLERGREELERAERERNEAAGQEAEGRVVVVGAVGRLTPHMRLALMGTRGLRDAAANARGRVAEREPLEGARLEEAWSRLAAGNVEVLGEVMRVNGVDEMGRAEERSAEAEETSSTTITVPPVGEDAQPHGGPEGEETPSTTITVPPVGEDAQAETHRRVGVMEMIIGRMRDEGEVVDGWEVFTELETAMESLRAQGDSPVVPEGVVERYREALEMVQMLMRGDPQDGEER